jgi:hypothetical protein
MIIQVLFVLFAAYALTRGIAHYRRGALGVGDFAMWVAFWTAVGGVVLVPQVTQRMAAILGVGRGVDAALYIAVVGLSYVCFKLYLRSLEQDRRITMLVRRLALDEAGDPKSDPPRGRSR